VLRIVVLVPSSASRTAHGAVRDSSRGASRGEVLDRDSGTCDVEIAGRINRQSACFVETRHRPPYKWRRVELSCTIWSFGGEPFVRAVSGCHH